MDVRLREHVLELLEGKFAHIDLATALKGFPLSKINTRLPHSPHTAWELLEHIRLAQWDILEFSRDAKHILPDFPDGYWNKTEASPADWKKSVKQVLGNLEEMRELVRDNKLDLFAKIAHGDVYLLPITFREGLTIREMAQLLRPASTSQRTTMAISLESGSTRLRRIPEPTQEICGQGTGREACWPPTTSRRRPVRGGNR